MKQLNSVLTALAAALCLLHVCACDRPGAPAALQSGDMLLLDSGAFDYWPGTNDWGTDWFGYYYSSGGLFGVSQDGRLLPPVDSPEVIDQLGEMVAGFTDMNSIAVGEDGTVYFACDGYLEESQEIGGIIGLHPKDGPYVLSSIPNEPEELEFDASGRYLYAVDSDSLWGGQGLYEVDLQEMKIYRLFGEDMLWHLAVTPNRKVYAANGSIVMRFDRTQGTSTTLVDYGLSYYTIEDMAAGRDGRVYVTVGILDSETGLIVRIDPSDDSLRHWELDFMPDKIAADTSGTMYFSGYLQDGLYRLSPEGTLSTFAGSLSHVGDIEVNASGYVFAATELGYLGVISPGGQTTTISEDGLVQPRKFAMVP